MDVKESEPCRVAPLLDSRTDSGANCNLASIKREGGSKVVWIKYSYVCNDCDALTEITTLQKLYDYRGWCACGSPNLVRVAVEDGRVKVK